MLIHFHPCDHITFELKHLHVFEIIIVLEKKLARLTVIVGNASFFCLSTILNYTCQRKPLCIAAYQLVVDAFTLAFKGQHMVLAMNVPINTVVNMILFH